jgi:hypothetical protein
MARFPVTMGKKLQATLMLALSFVAWSALALQLSLTLEQAQISGTSLSSSLSGYFSYFTILTNLLIAAAVSIPLVATTSGISAFLRRPSVITGVCICIVAGGIAYNILLRHLWAPHGLQRVADELLHVVTPVMFLAYWWLAVPRGAIQWSHLPWWLLYPATYLGFILARGAVVGRYPYPFLDASALGYGQIAINGSGLALALVVVGGALILVKRPGSPPNNSFKPKPLRGSA